MTKTNNNSSALGIICILATIVFVCFVTTIAKADTEGDFEYSVDNGNATITKYIGDGGEVIIPSKIGKYPVTRIGSQAFAGTTSTGEVLAGMSITKIVFKRGVSVIGSYAFISCENLTEVILPSSLIVLGESAFAGCNSLTEIAIPSSVESIREGCFSATNLSFFSVDKKNKTFISVDGILYSKDMTTLYQCPPAYSEDVFVIPDTVKILNDNAFYNCSKLRKIEIPASIKEIGSGVFGHCSSLEDIVLPAQLTELSSALFYGCSSLKKIELPEGITQIGSAAFAQCSALTDVTLPSTLTAVGMGTFRECTVLTQIKLPYGLESITSQMFGSCRNLESIVIPDSVTSIGDYAFEYCSKLKTIYIPASVTNISDSAFRGALSNITIFGSVNSFAEKYAAVHYGIDFSAVKSFPLVLLSIKIDSPELFVGQGVVFSALATGGGESRTFDFTIMKDNELVASSGFINSSEFVWLPLTEGNYFVQVTVRSDQEEVISSSDVFSISKMEVSKLFKYRTSGNRATILKYIGESGYVLVPERINDCIVTTIAASAFESNENLKQVILPDTISVIQKRAFASCSILQSVNIPENLVEIGEAAFLGCDLKGEYVFPETTKKIGYRAFSGCGGIVSAQFLSSKTDIESVGTYSFADTFAPGTYIFAESDSSAYQYAQKYYYPVSTEPINLDLSTISTVDEVVSWVIDHYITTNMDEFEKALILHDWLIGYADYNNGLEQFEDTSAKQVLLYRIGVCSGYAAAYNLLLKKAGIVSEYVHGIANGAHAWNLVRMEGSWYHVDCTWDDSTSIETRFYFGLSDAAIANSHTEFDTAYTCNSFACNYDYRSGALDNGLKKAQKDITSKLKKGATSFLIKVKHDGVYNPNGIDQIMLAALQDVDWSQYIDNKQITLSVEDRSTFDFKLQITVI